MPAPVEQTTFRGCGFPQIGCYTLHGSLTSPYQAGFLAPESTHHLSFSCFRTMAFENHSSVTVTGSLRFRTWFPLSDFFLSALNMFNMELYWHHTTTPCPLCQPWNKHFASPHVIKKQYKRGVRLSYCFQLLFIFQKKDLYDNMFQTRRLTEVMVLYVASLLILIPSTELDACTICPLPI